MTYNADKSSYKKDVIFKKEPQEYISVNTRLQEFREKYKDYRLINTILKLENGFVLFKSEVLDPEGNVVAIGHAYEKEGSSFINKTSYIENCETSAVGRALAFLGIKVGESIASKEEIENAKLQQKEKGIDQAMTVIEETEEELQTTIEKTAQYILDKENQSIPFNKDYVLTRFRDKYGLENLRKLQDKI